MEKKVKRPKLEAPQKRFAFDPALVESYLDAYCTIDGSCQDSPVSLEQRAVAQAVIENTRLVKYKTFWRDLRRAMIGMGLTFPNLFETHGDKWQSGPVEAKKSNTWVMDLALDMFPTFKSNKVDSSSQYVIFFDDALYTGLQMYNNIYQYLMKKLGTAQIIVVAPYMGTQAIQKIGSIATGKESKVHLFYAREMQPLHQTIPNALSELVEKHIGRSWRYPYIFEHKIADDHSTYPEIYSGYVPQLPKQEAKKNPVRSKGQMVPYLESCVEAYSEYYKDHDSVPVGQFLDLHQICPKPPYRDQ